MISSQTIKNIATEIGFDLCGITQCRHLAQNEVLFRDWLAHGYQSSLDYMERNTEKRFDPRLLVENSRTAVICAVAYKNPVGDGYPETHRAKIASYACMRDYHLTLRRMVEQLLTALRQVYPNLTGRAFTDTAPLAEKQLAVEAGLGWIGRQSLLVTPQFGSYVLLGEVLLTDEADAYDSPFEGSRCGRCRNCIESCPTGAIVAPKIINTAHCIACHTIEKEPLRHIDLHGWIFGCERCQSCCPYNREAPLHTNPAFDPLFDPREMTPAQWHTMSNDEFSERLGETPLTRSGLQRIQLNLPK